MFFFFPCMVVRDLHISDSLEDGTYVTLAGRKEGLWNFLMSIIGLGTEIRFEVTRTAVQREVAKMSSNLISTVPIKNVGSTHFGFTKNLLYLFLAWNFTLEGLLGSLFLFMQQQGRAARNELPAWLPLLVAALGLLLFVAYYKSKRLLIVVETAGGSLIGVRLKPGIIGGQRLGLEQAEDVVDLINRLSAGGRRSEADADERR